MQTIIHRAGLVLGCMVLLSSPAFAYPMWSKEWSKFENKSGKEYLMACNDAIKAVGSIWVRKPGEEDKKKWRKINKKGMGYTFKPGKYEVYFDTTAKGIGIHLLFTANGVSPIQLHVTNLDPMVTGTEIQVSGKPLSGCPLQVDPTGYRNLAGGTLFTLVPAGKTTGTEQPDEADDNDD